jgi:hypothetical protein
MAMDNDVLDRLQMLADIKDSSSIPPEFLDNTVFRKVITDAITSIQTLREQVKTAYYYPAYNQTYQTLSSATGGMYSHYIQYPYTTTATDTVAATMVYTASQQQALAGAAVQKAIMAAEEKGEAPPTQDEKDRLWDLIKSSVEGGG